MVNPGTYNAKVLSHAISETKAGLPQAVVKFTFEAAGTAHTLTWFGSFKEGALPHTIKALLACGLQGNNPGGALEIGKEVLIVVEDDKGEDGKTRNKISWVNAVNEIKKAIPKELALSKLAALEGAVLQARQKTGMTGEDEIPF